MFCQRQQKVRDKSKKKFRKEKESDLWFYPFYFVFINSSPIEYQKSNVNIEILFLLHQMTITDTLRVSFPVHEVQRQGKEINSLPTTSNDQYFNYSIFNYSFLRYSNINKPMLSPMGWVRKRSLSSIESGEEMKIEKERGSKEERERF